MIRLDIVTVFHNEINYQLHLELFDAIKKHEPDGGYRLLGVDNRVHNRGFARACNIGAFHPEADAPVVGFLNPDAKVHGPFIDQAVNAIDGRVVITGAQFHKSPKELQAWGITKFVCGAAMFVQRRWFTAVGGFDEQFVWSWEEVDLIRQAESQGLVCAPLPLPIDHDSPAQNSEQDRRYKESNFNLGCQRYYSKWGR